MEPSRGLLDMPLYEDDGKIPWPREPFNASEIARDLALSRSRPRNVSVFKVMGKARRDLEFLRAAMTRKPGDEGSLNAWKASP